MKNTSEKILNLSVCAGSESDFSEVQAVRTPQATESWFPIAHDALVETFRSAVEGHDELEIVNEHHTLHRFGQRYFGLFQVRGLNRKHGSDIGTVFGLRNSHDRQFRAGVSAGDAPFVCTNLIFSNEIVIGRKHTTHILRDLPIIVERAIGKLCDSWVNADERVDLYTGTDLDNTVAHDLILKAFRSGACSSTQIAKVAEQWHNPEHDEFSPRNLWSLANAFSNVYRGGLLQTPNRSASLYATLDPFAKAVASRVVA